ncbi:GNAT family N-acetyltransferase [Microbacterium sp. Sa4CUA7]|uniref:GNAT family N-acetyltransferase n=1 Tax=Microbacterium pullorum TaxID=2762236 RepID=A0ABR8S3N4_9MICO|nr:GNAT family protein [Microbacterium pullorum]MBD7958098.1 GNAT family N-acetyltransferase [Microbacterium pullorum]
MSVVLRPWDGRDAVALLAAAESASDLAPQFSGADLRSAATAEAFIEQSLRFDAHVKNWAIVEDGVAVGNVGASAIEYRHETAWVSYWLSAAARGKGYATAALLAVSDWAFEGGLYRLELGHRVNNPASCRVATAAGFRVEGIERQKLRYGNDRYDVETHARLAGDLVPASARAGALPALSLSAL